jgi:hypothetical protein
MHAPPDFTVASQNGDYQEKTADARADGGGGQARFWHSAGTQGDAQFTFDERTREIHLNGKDLQTYHCRSR